MLSDLPNLGPVSAKLLLEAGFENFNQIKEFGAATTFLRVERLGKPVSNNLLWALQGAIEGVDWRGIDSRKKQQLLDELAQMRI